MKNSASQSAFFNPRVLAAVALCSCGVLLAMLSLAATPGETKRSNDSLAANPLLVQNSPSTLSSNANTLPAGVPLLPGAAMGGANPSGAGFSRLPFSPAGTPSWANPALNPMLGNLQPASLNGEVVGADGNSPSGAAAAGNWSIVDSPDLSSTQATNFLYGVTCVSESDCWAVGYYYPGGPTVQTLAEHWNGTSWTVVPSPNIPAQDNILSSVTCASASDCWAVGYHYIPSSPGFHTSINQTLIERWNGTSWTIVTSPNTSPTEFNSLSGVTCTSASDCWAVGYHYISSLGYPSNYDPGQTLIEHWDGTSWTIVTSPNASPTEEFNSLSGVTCASVSDCWAVGYHYIPSIPGTNTSINQTLIERWDGTSWTIVISPNSSPAEVNSLSGVTCTSASDCWAVGHYRSGNSVEQTLIEHWDGTLWTIVISPNPLDQNNILAAVTCVSASECWAVGKSTPIALTIPQATTFETLIERWDGTLWTIVTSPNTSTATGWNPFLSGVTCVSASDCWAVGAYYNGAAAQTLIERWDGTSWAIITSASAGRAPYDVNTQFSGVTCASASDCWAVGTTFNPLLYFTSTLIERWNGTSWTQVTSPHIPATSQDVLSGVTCASASDCWAVGFYYDEVAGQTLIERWDGTSWTIVTSPSNTAGKNVLSSVTCASASDCWAVGSSKISDQTALQTLIERWDGTSWTIVTSPNTSATQSNSLSGVTCASPADCWAVGTSGTSTLIEHWNGTSWSIVTSPNFSPAQANFLSSVTCASNNNCWAVGFYGTPAGSYQTLTEHWDGTSWTLVTSPNFDDAGSIQHNLLYGVACGSAMDCWAVGYHFNADFSTDTLTEHYTAGSGPIPLAAVSRKTHGTAGDFDIDLPLAGNPGIECRNFQDTNSGRHQIVITFAAPVTVNGSQDPKATLTAPKGGSVDTVDVNNSVVTVNLKDVGNEQTITLTLLNVSDGTNSGNVSIPMGVLLGDTSANRLVNSTDVSQTQAQSGQTVTGSNFRTDVSVNGLINSTDVSIVQSKSGTGLP